MLRSMKKDFRGFTIGATDGDIGKVEEFYFDDASFTVRHLVVDTGGWLGHHKVLISPMALRDLDWVGKRVKAALSKVQVEKSPVINTDKPVSRQHEIEYYSYYGYPPYWARESGDSHLRSSAAVIGYHIAATDGDIGHVEDFLVDDATWAIRYVVVDTRNWRPGKRVLVSPEWIERVDWSDAKVHVGVTREQIKQSPEYDPLNPVARDYEARLHDHYGRPRYWERRAR